MKMSKRFAKYLIKKFLEDSIGSLASSAGSAVVDLISKKFEDDPVEELPDLTSCIKCNNSPEMFKRMEEQVNALKFHLKCPCSSVEGTTALECVEKWNPLQVKKND